MNNKLGRILRLDSWATLFGGFGDVRKDKLEGASYQRSRTLSRVELDDLYRFNGIAAAIIDLPAFEATREGFDVKLDDPEVAAAVEGALSRLPIGLGVRGAGLAIRRALSWSRLYGGAAIILGCDDGLDARFPLNLAQLRAVRFLRVHHRHELRPLTWETDLTSETCGEPETYQLNPDPRGAAAARRGEVIHASRILRFNGVEAPGCWSENDGWGDPVLNRVFERLRNEGIVDDAASRTVLEKNIPIFRINGLAEMIGAGEDGERKVKQRAAMLARCKSLLNAILLDGQDESFEYIDASLGGLAELLDRYPMRTAAAARIPITKLYGVSPAGFSTGESDLRNYYDMVSGELIEPIALPAYAQLVEMVMASKEGPTGGRLPASWTVEARPLWQPSEKEQAEVEELSARRVATLIAAGVVTPAEVAESQFTDEGWRSEIRLAWETRRQEASPTAPPPGENDKEDANG